MSNFSSLKQSGDVPLGIAAHNGHGRTVKRLLQAKANVNHRNKVMTVHSLTTTAVTIPKILLHGLVALITHFNGLTEGSCRNSETTDRQKEKALKCKPSVNCACAILLN